MAVGAQGLVGHHRAKVGAADPDVDDVLDGPARVALPAGAADVSGEGRHAVEHRVHPRHYVGTVNNDPLTHRRPQCDVKDRPLLGHIDLTAAEHGTDVLGQVAVVGQPEKEPERLVGDAMLGVVEVEAGGFARQALPPQGVVGKDLPEMHIADRTVVLLQRLPRRARGERLGRRHPVDGHGLPAAARFRCASMARFAARQSRRSFQDRSNDAVPSRCS